MKTLEYLKPVLEKAKYILELSDNWDDEGAQGYTKQSLDAASDFLLNYYNWLNSKHTGEFYLPNMFHGPNGTIDLDWREDEIRLLINIDLNKNTGSFYADTPNNQSTEGTFKLNNINFNLIPTPVK